MTVMHFIDLQTQYRTYQAEIDAPLYAAMQRGHFITGTSLKGLRFLSSSGKLKPIRSRSCTACLRGPRA